MNRRLFAGASDTGRPWGGHLLRNTDFNLVWTGHSVSRLGDQVGQVVLPLVAVTVLGASTLEVSFLTAMSTAAVLLIALPAGVLVDRLRARPLMVLCDLVRVAAFASIPAAHFLGGVTLAQLYLSAFTIGLCGVVFDVASKSYLPTLIGRERLVEGNAKLTGSSQIALIAGPGLAGLLMAGLGAPFALLATSVGYLLSGVAISSVKKREGRLRASGVPALGAQVREGMRFVFQHPLLRRIAMATAWASFFGAMVLALGIVFLVRDLEASPALIGFILSAGSIGGVIAAFSASTIASRLGLHKSLVLGLSSTGGLLLIPLATPGYGVALFVVGSFLYTFGSVLFNVGQVTLRQQVTPFELLGRMNATLQLMAFGVLPFGAVIGGLCGEVLGVRTTLLIGGVGAATGVLWLLGSAKAEAVSTATIQRDAKGSTSGGGSGRMIQDGPN